MHNEKGIAKQKKRGKEVKPRVTILRKRESLWNEVETRGRLQFQARETRNTWSSYKERKGNALALGAEEGRVKLRKATGSRKKASIRGYPNGAIRSEASLSIMH